MLKEFTPLLLILIFVCGEVKAQRCATLTGTNKAICYDAANATDLVAFVVGGNVAGATFKWCRADGSEIINPSGAASTALSSAAYTAGQPYTYSSHAAGRIHEVRVTQTAADCGESSPVSIFVMQQPPLAVPSKAAANVDASGVCNGTSIGLTSDSPSQKTLGVLTFDTEIFWSPVSDAVFSHNPSSSNVSAAVSITPEPMPSTVRMFRYVLRYRVVSLAAYNVDLQACPSPESEAAEVTIWPAPSNAGSVTLPQTICSGVSFEATLTGHNTDGGATTVDGWVRNSGGEISVRNVSIMENPATEGTYTYHARLVRNNGVGKSCTKLSVSATIRVVKFDLKWPEYSRVCVGNSTTISCTLENPENLTTTLQWEVDKTQNGFTVDDTGVPASRTTLTLQLQEIPISYNGYQYRLQARGSLCTKSSKVTLSVNPQPSFTTSPVNQSVCMGSDASFTAAGSTNTAPAGTLTYQWEEANTETFTPIPSSSNATANSASLILTAVERSINGYKYRVKIGNGLCTALSHPATLTVYELPAFTQEPVGNPLICDGVRQVFSAVATTNNPRTPEPSLLYEWMEDKGNTGTFSAVGANHANYRVERVYDVNNNANNTILVKVKVSDAFCFSWSSTVRNTIRAMPIITRQPISVNTCAGTQAIFTMGAQVAAGDEVAYQWEEDLKGDGNFTALSPAVNTATLTIDNPLRLNHYRGVAYNKNRCESTSNPVDMTVLPAPIFPNNPPIPNTASTCIGGSFRYDGTANPSSATGTITYQWKIWNTTTNTYDDISGQTNSVYNLISPTAAMNGNKYKVVAVLGTCTRESNISTLALSTGPPIIDTHPQSQSICRGDNAVFTVATSAQSPTYQWEEDANTGNFVNMTSQTSTTLTLTTPNGNGYRYRVTVSIGTCSTSSDIATLTFTNNAPTVGSLAANPQVCRGATYRFTSNSSSVSGTLKYQWQEATPTGTFSTLGTETTDNFLDVANLQTTKRYKVIVRIDGSSCQRESAPSTLTVNPLPTTSDLPDQNACPDENVIFTTTTGGGTAPYTYQWKQGAGNVGSNSNSLLLPSIQSSDNGKTFTVTVTDSKLCFTSTPVAQLTVKTLAIDDQPTSQTVCSDKQAVFSVGVQAGSSIQWREASPNGAFADIEGASSDTYMVMNVAEKNGYRYQAIVSSRAFCNNQSNVATLTVNNAPVISAFTQTGGTICSGSDVNYTVSASGTSLRYQWLQDQNTGILTNVGNDANAYLMKAVTVSQTGYKTTVRVINGNNCFVTANPSFTLIVNPTPDAAADAVPNAICTGGTTNIILRNPNNVTGTAFKWTVTAPVGVTQWANQTTPVKDPIAQTLLSSSTVGETVTYRITPVAGNCEGVPVSATVSVNPIPDVRADAETTTICSGESIHINLSNPNGVAGTTFKWTVSAPMTISGWKDQDTGAAGPINQTLASTASSTQSVDYLIVPTLLGCNGQSVMVTINVKSLVQINSHPKNTLVCPGQEIKLVVNAAGTPPLTYQWKRNGVDIPNAQASHYSQAANEPDNGAKFRVAITNPCETNHLSNEALLTVDAGQSFQKAEVKASTLTPDCLEAVTFYYSGPSATFDWDFGDNSLHSNFEDPTHNYTAVGPFTVTLKAQEENCSKIFTMNLTVTGAVVNPHTGDSPKNGVKYYPVPMQETLTISSGKKIGGVAITTATGKQVLSTYIGATGAVLNTSNLPSGIYILIIETENEVNQFKVVK